MFIKVRRMYSVFVRCSGYARLFQSHIPPYRYSFTLSFLARVKKALDASNGGLWHVIAGQAFGASVAHDNNMLLMFRIGKVYFLVFQSFDDVR